jgi:hypothetical protein
VRAQFVVDICHDVTTSSMPSDAIDSFETVATVRRDEREQTQAAAASGMHSAQTPDWARRNK